LTFPCATAECRQTPSGLPRPSHHPIEDLIEEGDKVVSRDTVAGIDQGEYMGIPPTGKSVMYNEISILRFTGGRIAETWGTSTFLPDETARRNSRFANLTKSAQEDRHSKFYEFSD
jgi:ketosteroid isomerase-like protein